jgi:hypothetical protein
MDAIGLDFQVCLVLNETRPVDDKNGAEAVKKMEHAGAMVIGNF